MAPSSEVTHSPRRNVEGIPDSDELVKILREMEADLVNVYTFNVQGLVEKGVLLPLDDFSGGRRNVLEPGVLSKHARAVSNR